MSQPPQAREWPLDETHPEHPRQLIPELCRLFYANGWVTGTGGGISIRAPRPLGGVDTPIRANDDDDDDDRSCYYVAPSGVQKERLRPDDLFVLDRHANVIEAPRSATASKCKQSECTPLFFNAFTLRHAAACIHTHSPKAVLLTMLLETRATQPTSTSAFREFRISHVEMIKGIHHPIEKRSMRYDEQLVVPIIDNTNFESELTQSMAQAMVEYPLTNCVVVRRHGVYVWGDTWQRAKTMTECYDYLFTLAIEMIQAGIPLTAS